MESDPNFGMFKGTGGLGLKLLMKMGYKPGEALGTTGEGIVQPLEPVVRPKQMGLAFGDFVENAPLTKKEDEVKDILEPTSTSLKKRANSTRSSFSQAYKKSKKLTPTYLTSKELIEATKPSLLVSENVKTETKSSSSFMDQTDKNTNLKIIDMRFSEPTEIDVTQLFTLSTLNQENIHLGPGIKYQVSEFLTKLNSVTHQSEITLRRIITEKMQLTSKLSTHQEKITSLEKETQVLQESTSKLRSLLSQVHPIHSNQDLNPQLQLLHSFQVEFPSSPIDALTCALVIPWFRSLFNQWHPFDVPNLGISELNLVRNLLSNLPIPSSFASTNTLPSLNTNSVIPMKDTPPNPSLHSNTKPTYYDALLWHLWLPRVRSAFLSDWDVYASTLALDFLNHWYPHTLTPLLYSFLRRHLILPKLQATLESWHPLNDPSLESWFLPWIQHHFSDLPFSSYFPSLTHKLGYYFERLNPFNPLENETAISLLLSLKDIWSSDTYTQFIQRYVVPRLQLCLSQSLIINPADQDLTPMEAIVFTWLPYLSTHHFISILTKAFFPSWLQVLYDWLTSKSPKYDEIATWYETWKRYFPSELVALGPIQVHFKIGLDMMRRALAGVPIPSPTNLMSSILPLSTSSSTLPSSSIPSLQRTSVTLTFKDVLEKELERWGRMLIPTNLTEPTSSKPIYKIDSYLCYIDQSVVFIKINDLWVPKDLHQLEQLFSTS